MKKQTSPQHVAIICDGNRRWAKAQGLAAVVGHQQAASKTFEPLVDGAIAAGISYLTFWVFSTENWNRSKLEVGALMTIFREQLDRFANSLDKGNVRFRTIGDLSKFPQDIQEKIASTVEQTKNNKAITVVFALNYGGRDEITRAVTSLAAQVASGSLTANDITQELISNTLDTSGIPDPDLIIRTGGEQRMSGFMPWQSVYAEYAFVDTYFPDFSRVLLEEVLAEFAARERRFGH